MELVKLRGFKDLLACGVFYPKNDFDRSLRIDMDISLRKCDYYTYEDGASDM